ncbi:MAG: hypothetical protein GX184_05675 [Clostridiaceae bacterium]|nr:hypothetical protein [Clostridiaceae bacterium]
MKAMLYLIRRSLINLIKGIFKKPSILIGYIFIVVFFGGLILASFLMPSGLIRAGSPQLFNGIMVLAFVFFYTSNLRVTVDRGSTFYRLADVNLLFTAPISPNKILIYGFIKQLGATLVLIVFAMFQIPNLKNNFIFRPYGIWMIILAAVFYALSYPLLGMLVYSWSSKDKQRAKTVKKVLNLLSAVLVLLTLYNLYQTRNLGESIINVFNSPIARYFPLAGWAASIASAAVSGISVEFYVGITGMVLFIAGISIALYHLKLDYYEDVLSGTEYLEAVRKAKREGNTFAFNLKVRDKVSQKLWGTGARTILSKQLLEYRKMSFFFFFDVTTVTIIISTLVFRLIIGREFGGDASLMAILFFSAYMLLLFQAQGRLNVEMERPFIYLIPDSSAKKLFYATAAEHIKNFFDGLLLFLLSGIMFKAGIQTIFACTLTYVAFGSVFVYTDVLSRRIFGWVHSKGLLIFLKVISSLLIQVPGIIAAIIAASYTGSEIMAVYAMCGWGLVLSITFFMFSSGILNNLESAG